MAVVPAWGSAGDTYLGSILQLHTSEQSAIGIS